MWPDCDETPARDAMPQTECVYVYTFEIDTSKHVEQERRLKRRNTLGGLDISIFHHQVVNTLELSPPPPPPPPPPKKKKKKSGEVSNNKYM